MHSAPAVIDPPASPSSLPIRAPGLSDLRQGLDEDRRVFVLDLGAIRRGTVDFFSGLRCRLDVLDLPAFLAPVPAPDQRDPFERLLLAALPSARGELMDSVLGWNLLNYLSPGRLETLGRMLKPRLRSGAVVHALIEYSARHMPARPAAVAPDGVDALRIDDHAPEPLETPRYSAGKLERHLAGFQAERTMLLSNGMQEYLLRRTTEA